MAVRRMNELWRSVALALTLGSLLLHSCQGQQTDSPTATPGPNTSPAGRESTAAPGTDSAPANPTTVITAKPAELSTPEPIIGSANLNESNASGNSQAAATTASPPAQPRSTAFLWVAETEQAINTASNQKSLALIPSDGKEASAESGASPAVFVSVLISGLLLAAIIIGIYYFRCHRQTNGKGMKLAEESYMADEENQGNTLVSVAPLSQPEPQEKPSLNGESQSPAASNGHSATKTADTEL